MKKGFYRRTFKRVVKSGFIVYAGFKYTSDVLKKVPDGEVVLVTKFGEEKGTFDISKLLIDPLPHCCIKQVFWVS